MDFFRFTNLFQPGSLFLADVHLNRLKMALPQTRIVVKNRILPVILAALVSFGSLPQVSARDTTVTHYDVNAVEWFQKSAAHGNASGQYLLGGAYLNGWGIPKNESKADEWFIDVASEN